jgi:hypothetical protein
MATLTIVESLLYRQQWVFDYCDALIDLGGYLYNYRRHKGYTRWDSFGCDMLVELIQFSAISNLE